MAATSVMTIPSSSRKRRDPYTTVACDECKRRKIKCSGERPCAACGSTQIECVYDRQTRFRRGSASSVKRPADEQQRQPPRLAASARASSPGSSSAENAQSMSPSQVSATSLRPGSTDYYFNLAQELRTGPEPGRRGGNLGSSPRMGPLLRKANEYLSKNTSARLVTALDADSWLDVIDLYEEEIGLQYPFLDLDGLREDIRAVAQDVAPIPFYDSSSEEQPGSTRRDQILSFLLAILAVLEDPDVSELADSFTIKARQTTVWRAQLETVDEQTIYLFILMSIYNFMTDREVMAWRNIGSVLRMLQELGYHSSTCLRQRFKSKMARDRAKRVFWAAFTLDRRWSFGTGLPFAIHETDIDYDVDFTVGSRPAQPSSSSSKLIQISMLQDDTISTAYLRSMVAYCRIAAESRNSIVGNIWASHSKEAARDLLNYKVLEWQQNLGRLHLDGNDPRFDPLRESRGQYRLRLILFLRANQMRMVIHRMAAFRARNGRVDTLSMQTMLEVARDTIRVLSEVAQTTDVYQAQQKTFNHFLESAISSLLLFIGSRRTVDELCCCTEELQMAMDLVRKLATRSSMMRKLRDKLEGFELIRSTLAAKSRVGPCRHPRKDPYITNITPENMRHIETSTDIDVLATSGVTVRTASIPMSETIAGSHDVVRLPGVEQAERVSNASQSLQETSMSIINDDGHVNFKHPQLPPPTQPDSVVQGILPNHEQWFGFPSETDTRMGSSAGDRSSMSFESPGENIMVGDGTFPYNYYADLAELINPQQPNVFIF
ncbi:hypothetical protein BX600DRAFT_504510 [Xylariales sp. PMI_506]|nr:hypothetical protein BX600DRAFT_504510 [Xylariales sp. PMI_506]